MNAYVDPDLCIGCTQCAGLCPAVFHMEGVLAVAEPGPIPPGERYPDRGVNARRSGNTFLRSPDACRREARPPALADRPQLPPFETAVFV